MEPLKMSVDATGWLTEGEAELAARVIAENRTAGRTKNNRVQPARFTEKTLLSIGKPPTHPFIKEEKIRMLAATPHKIFQPGNKS